MKKITLLIALCFLSYGITAQVAFGFLVEENWLETCNQPDNAGSLTFEDFMGDPTEISDCGVEISSTGDACFPAGELQGGFSITAESNNQISFAPVGTINNTTPLVGASSPTQFLIVNFDRPNINRVAFQLFTQQTNLIDVRVFDTNGDLINNLNINISTAFTNTFYGIFATASIGRLEIEQITTNPGFLLIGEMRFGNCVEDCETAVFFPEGGFPLNIEIDPGSTSTADCDNAPNLIPITVNRAGIIGQDATFNSIFFDIEHTFTGDLELSLISPAGTELLIVADQGAGVDNGYNGTSFADDTADITEATAPYGDTATFSPQGGRFDTTFFGESITGDWMIKICDDAGGDTGQVLNAGIFFCAQEEVNPPVNDLIENAIDVDEIGFPFTDSDINFPDATNDPINSDNCNGSTLNSVWYKFTTTETGIITASFEDPTNNDNKTIVFYTADNENVTLDDLLTFVNSGTNTCGFNLELSFEADANQTYYAFAQASTSVQTININFTPAPPNDLIENAIDLDELGFPYTDSDIDFPNATSDILTNSGCDAALDSVVWYTFTAFADGTVTGTFENPVDNTDSLIVFYSADNENATLDDLTFVNSGTNVCDNANNHTNISIEAVAGQTYYILINSNVTSTITIESDTVLSTEENTIEGFSFFPNPIKDVLNVNANQSIDQITLYNITGQKVMEQKINATSTQISLGNLPSGIYLMTARTGTIEATYKVIKQ